MFSFGSQSSPFDEVVEKATAETLLEENWGLMMDISDKVSMEGQKACKNVKLSIKKRLNNRDPHVVIYALSLLDCLWKNAGTEFRRSVSSKDFVPELRDKSISSINAVAIKTCTILKEWSENECAKDPSLALISSLYKELNDQGLFFENSEPKKTKQAFSTDPNVVSSAEEEAQLALAIAASLNDTSIKKTAPTSVSHYPSLSQPSQSNILPPAQSYREVKALYDFEAAEDNELNMRAGDSIMVLEDSDANWWKGQSHRGVGLFPSSFVTGDLTDSTNNYTNGNHETPTEEPPVQIDEEALIKCIQLLEECDPTGETPDPPALAYFENMALQMAPLIDRKLANIDRQHNMLANVDIAMRDVLATYDQAVQQVQIPQMPPQMYNNYPQQGYGMGGATTPQFPQQLNQFGQFLPQQFAQQMGYPGGFPNHPSPAPQQQFHSTQFQQQPIQQQMSGSNLQQMGYQGFLNNPSPAPQQQLHAPQTQTVQPQPLAAAHFVRSQQLVTNEVSLENGTPQPETQVADERTNPTQQAAAHSSPAPQQQFQPIQPFAAAHFVRPQQSVTNEVSHENGTPQPETQVADERTNPTQQAAAHSSPAPQQQLQPIQPVAAAHFVRSQQSVTNEVSPENGTPQPETQVADERTNPTQQAAAHSSLAPQQQFQPIQPFAAAHLVRPQQHQQTILNESQAVQENETPVINEETFVTI